MSKEYATDHPMARKTGEVIGHSLTTVAGALETAGAVTEGISGAVVTATGVGAPVGILAIAGSVLAGAQGAAVTYTGASNSVKSTKDLYRMFESEGPSPNSSTPSKPSSAKSGKSEGTPASQKPSKPNEKLPGTKGTGQAAKSVIEKEKWLESLQSTENFKQGTKENGLNHIFDGEILKNGNANGFHYEGMPNSNGKIVGNIDPLMSLVSIKPMLKLMEY
ncbi:hypothetical protein ACFQY3_18215 [Paenibacillus farraposensis]|uniref:hypothetical protein n=1 Tax=Paenibacillus farraposensis TaxID=2807095 RepID=UPI00361332EA